ncbi:MAG: hypothetical protein IJI44_00470 [Erysipelotrichaceae bacterium]|nr:hypothetical protein [Erysipelotrichaceae bacterium]
MKSVIRKAFLSNILLAVLELFAVSWMMSGRSGGVLSGSGIRVLKYFTIDSNIFLGVAAFIAAVNQYLILKGKMEKVPSYVYLLKLSGTAAVTVTLLVTVFFLEPTMGKIFGYLALFSYSNFFLHLLNPISAIVTWMCFEKNDALSLRSVLIATIPTVIYALYYVMEVLLHTDNGSIMPGYDWYGFFAWGLKSAAIVIPLFLLFTFLVCLVLYRLGKSKMKHTV